MTDTEEELLDALTSMAAQYLRNEDWLDNVHMGAGERTFAVLAKHGLITISPGGRFAQWTEAGEAFLDAH
jgi:hypothetical protein